MKTQVLFEPEDGSVALKVKKVVLKTVIFLPFFIYYYMISDVKCCSVMWFSPRPKVAL